MLVNNVGGPKGGSLLDLTDDDWTSSFELHLLSYVRLIREAFPYLKKDGDASLISLHHQSNSRFRACCFPTRFEWESSV